MSGQASMVSLAAISHPAIGSHDGDPSESVASPQQLLAELSHDLRTPLASIRLMVQALRDGLVDDSGPAEYLDRIEQQISLLSALVDEVHSVARVQAGGRDWPTECVGPQELIEAAFATMRIQAEEKAVALECEVSPHLPRIRANPIQLRRALLNLIENAVRHARDTVVVRAERVLGGVEIEVQDDGEGIAAEERERVFSAFQGTDRRGSAARSGLGLAIARATVQAYGGRIWFADSQSGTRVRLSLPTTARRCPRLRRTSDDSLSTASDVHISHVEMEPPWPHYIPPHPSMS